MAYTSENLLQRRRNQSWYAKLSPEARAAVIERAKERQRGLSPETRAKYNAAAKAKRDAIPEDAKAAIRAAQRAAYAAAKAALRQRSKPQNPAPETPAASAKQADQRRGTRQANKARFAAWKAALGCAHCSESNPDALQFHHRDPAQKTGDVSKMVWNGSIRRAEAEARKCVVLCATCHAKAHPSARPAAASLL